MMHFFLMASVLVVLLSSIGLAKSEERAPVDFTKETMLPGVVPEESKPQLVSLEDVIKQVMQNPKNKILAAKTELVEGKKIHVVKVLTPTGHIQYVKIDATTGKNLDNTKK